MKHETGFSFVEIIIVLAILSIITVVSIPSFFTYRVTVELEEGARSIVGKLRQVQGKAIANEDFKKWGIRFTNPSGSAIAFYEVFSGSSYDINAVQEKIFLPSGLDFTTPGDGLALDVIFNQLLGTVDSSKTIMINSRAQSNRTKTITIDVSGKISSD